MHVLLVEDDPLQAEWILDAVRNAFGTGVDVTRIPTASAFLAQLGALEASPPAVFIVDEMLRWADPPSIEEIEQGIAQVPPPPDWRPSRAGVDVIARIRESPALKHVPTILYTVLERADVADLPLPNGVEHVTKNADAAHLISAIRTALQRPRSASA